MRAIRHGALATAIGVLLGGMPAAAQEPVPLATLVQESTVRDGQTVTVEGEVLGDVFRRGGHGWVNLADATGTIGVRAPALLLGRISHTGSYTWRGDRVRVTGSFHRADAAGGGEAYVAAGELLVVQPGAPIPHPVSRGHLALAGLALAAGGLLGVLWWRQRRPSGHANPF